jgi:hypothetical protein
MLPYLATIFPHQNMRKDKLTYNSEPYVAIRTGNASNLPFREK